MGRAAEQEIRLGVFRCCHGLTQHRQQNAGDSKLGAGMLKHSSDSDSKEAKQSSFSTGSNSCSRVFILVEVDSLYLYRAKNPSPMKGMGLWCQSERYLSGFLLTKNHQQSDGSDAEECVGGGLGDGPDRD